MSRLFSQRASAQSVGGTACPDCGHDIKAPLARQKMYRHLLSHGWNHIDAEATAKEIPIPGQGYRAPKSAGRLCNCNRSPRAHHHCKKHDLMIFTRSGKCPKCEAAEQSKFSSAKQKCPECGSTDYGLMPSDFETAKCSNCGKNWNHGIVKGVNDPKTADYPDDWDYEGDVYEDDAEEKKEEKKTSAFDPKRAPQYPCSNCGKPVVYHPRLKAWMHLSLKDSNVCSGAAGPDSGKTAGPLQKAILPAALMLGLGGPATKSEPPVPKAPVVQKAQVSEDEALDRIVEAIRRAEGAKPELNNPGNLVDFHTGELKHFDTYEDGEAALIDQLLRIKNGEHPNLKPDMSLEKAGLIYSNGDPNWANNVSKILHVPKKTPLGEVLNGQALPISVPSRHVGGPVGNDPLPDGPVDFFEPVENPHSVQPHTACSAAQDEADALQGRRERLEKLKKRTGMTDDQLKDLVKKQHAIDNRVTTVDMPGIPVGGSAKMASTLGGQKFVDIMPRQPKDPEAMGPGNRFICTRCAKDIDSADNPGFIDRKGLPVHAGCGRPGEEQEYKDANQGNGYHLDPKYFPAWAKIREQSQKTSSMSREDFKTDEEYQRYLDARDDDPDEYDMDNPKWVVMCSTSGGVTGRRQSPMKKDGKIIYYNTEEEAKAAAAKALASLGKVGPALIHYSAKPAHEV